MNKTRHITNPQVTEYMNGFYRAASPELDALRRQAETDDVPIILKETEDYLNTLLAMVKPKRILEIGTAVGYSAAYFAVKSGADVVTIEKGEDVHLTAKSNIEALGLTGQVRLYCGDGEEETMKLLDAGEESFDLVFIDAAKSHYKRFLDAALKLSHPGTVIVADNVLFQAKTVSDEYDPSGKHKTNIRRLREFIEYVYDHPALETSLAACGDGLTISVVKEI
jgi:predicted O-methyltransferase YrrM